MAKRPKPGAVKKSEPITVYFVTNRDPQPKRKPTTFGGGFNVEALNALRFGRAEFAMNELKSPSLTIFDEDLNAKAPVLGSKTMFEELRKAMKEKRQDTVFFIHGFNYTFDDALVGAAEFKMRFDSVARNWIVFTWPSDGSMKPIVAYQNDRLDAAASGAAMARGILKAAEFIQRLPTKDLCGQRIHLVAHSMGNYVLRNTVQELKKFVGGRLPRLFDQIILLGADEDTDALELPYKLGPLEDLGRRTTVYYNEQDVALFISSATKRNPARLGGSGPRNPSAIPSCFTLVNASAAGVSDAEIDPTRHQYYLKNDSIRDDMLAVLDGKDDVTIEGELGYRTWRMEGRYWRLDSADSKRGKPSKKSTSKHEKR